MTKISNIKQVSVDEDALRAQISRAVTMQKSRGTINTIEDLTNLYYPWKENPQLLQKADDPMHSGTTGVHNVVYGQLVWEQLNMESNMWGVLRKEPWIKSGKRVKKARGAHTGSMGELDDIPEAEKSDLDLLVQTVAIAAHSFQLSRVQKLLSETQDDSIGSPMEWLKNDTAIEHKKALNEMFTTTVNTLPGDDWQSMDRLISSTNEVTLLSYDADDENIEGIDRSANPWFDAYVDVAAADRDLTKDMLRACYRETHKFKEPGDQYFWVTGHDTLDEIASLYEPQGRFNFDAVKVQPSVNGIQTFAPGADVGYHAATLFGDPIITVDDMLAKGSISDIMYVNMSDISVDILEPTQYAQQGSSNGNPWAKNKLVDDGIFWTIGNLRMKKAKSSGKITKIQ